MGYRSRIVDRLVDQGGVVAVWQMKADGCTEAAVDSAVADMREVHNGVYLSGHAPPTWTQLWKAAELTTPESRLGFWSGATLVGMRHRDRMPTTIVRPGTGGPEFVPPRPGRIGSLLIYRSMAHLDTDTIIRDGIETLSASRNLLDLVPKLGETKAKRLARETLRLKAATPVDLNAVVAKHHGRRGVARLRRIVKLYAELPFDRARSDPEIVAAELIAAAGLPAPAVNVVIAGAEADLVYLKHRKIVELDGPQYHQFPEEDARKQKLWEDAGFTVDRLPTGDVYDRPHLLLALVPQVHLP